MFKVNCEHISHFSSISIVLISIITNYLFQYVASSKNGFGMIDNTMIDNSLQSKSMDWFLNDRDLRHERVNTCCAC